MDPAATALMAQECRGSWIGLGGDMLTTVRVVRRISDCECRAITR